ncbi:Transcriptional regulator, MarR family [Streptococcus sp. DD11]|nr:Transcriptional regulator, MarR family [Streptococcus sp. DD11]
MDYRQLFRQMGLISRQAMLKMNQQARSCGLDNNLFLLLTRIVENEGLSQSRLAEMVQIDKTTLSRSLGKLEERGLIVKKPTLKTRSSRNSIPAAKRSNFMIS